MESLTGFWVDKGKYEQGELCWRWEMLFEAKAAHKRTDYNGPCRGKDSSFWRFVGCEGSIAAEKALGLRFEDGQVNGGALLARLGRVEKDVRGLRSLASKQSPVEAIKADKENGSLVEDEDGRWEEATTAKERKNGSLGHVEGDEVYREDACLEANEAKATGFCLDDGNDYGFKATQAKIVEARKQAYEGNNNNALCLLNDACDVLCNVVLQPRKGLLARANKADRRFEVLDELLNRMEIVETNQVGLCRDLDKATLLSKRLNNQIAKVVEANKEQDAALKEALDERQLEQTLEALKAQEALLEGEGNIEARKAYKDKVHDLRGKALLIALHLLQAKKEDDDDGTLLEAINKLKQKEGKQ